jgi:thioredoxin 2
VTAPAPDRRVSAEVARDACLALLEQVFRRLGAKIVAETRSGDVGCPRCGRRNRVPAAGTGVPVCGNCRHALPWIAAARDEDFAAVAVQVSLPVLVALWAPWCGLSWMVRPVLRRLARARPGELKLVEVDVAAAREEVRRLAVHAVPTLLVLRRGEVLARRYGAAPGPELRDWLDESLSRAGADAAERTGTSGLNGSGPWTARASGDCTDLDAEVAAEPGVGRG